MACITDPKADSVCLNTLSYYNPYNYSGFWQTGFSSPAEYGCDTWVYLGRYIKTDSSGKQRVYGDPPTAPDDIYVTSYYRTDLYDTQCSISGANGIKHATYIKEVTYSEPYDWLNNGDMWTDKTTLEYYDYYLLIDNAGIPNCPEGEVFDPVAGVCVQAPIDIPTDPVTGTLNMTGIGSMKTLNYESVAPIIDQSSCIDRTNFWRPYRHVTTTPINRKK